MSTAAAPRSPSTAGRPVLRTAALVVGLLAHLALAVPYAASGLLAPLWAVLGLWCVWLALLAVLVLQRARPLVVLAVPVLAVALLAGAVTLGEQLLGWTA